MRVLITGGAGFIGSSIAQRHLERDDEVIVVDDLSTGSVRNLTAAGSSRSGASLVFHRADLVTWQELDEAVAQVDRIYHMAAMVGVFRVLEDPVGVLRTNIAGTERLFRAIERAVVHPEVVVASSSEVYGPDRTDLLTEESPAIVHSTSDHRWSYAVTKIADEVLALAYGDVNEVPVVVARLFNTVGPRQSGQYGMVIPRFVAQAVAGDPITVFGDGSQMRCFCDVRDTARALDLLASEPRAHGQVVNVGSDSEISILELAERVKRQAESDSPIQLVPYEEAYGRPFHDFQDRRPSLTKLSQLTGFEERFTLEQTLDELIDAERRTPRSALTTA